jgi:hypothetical protein
MNERIGKLAVEAGALWHHGDWNMPSCVYFGEKDLEKFAELIVKECADVALREDHEPDECILRHFGVKR